MTHPLSLQTCLRLPRSEAELRQIRKATLLSTVNSLVFIGGPVLIAMGGARAWYRA